MDKLKMQSENLVNANIEKIAALFPNCITEAKNDEGQVVKMIDFDLLKQELSNTIVEGDKERYTMSWPDKKQAILTANAPISKTLRPCKEESVDFENTQNLYIEGDNLDVLKLLRETYLGKIKMIYIDPPYNTGNDFVYNDNFATDTEEYLSRSNQVDEEGNRLVINNESNGRFHTDWLNMIYPRLKLSKDLLSDDGVIFISMDENEITNLRKVCDEIFGAQNYVQEIIWQKKFSPQNDAKYFSLNHESILCIAKNKPCFSRNLLPITEQMKSRYKNLDNDPRGPWTSGDCTIGRITEKDYYAIITPSGREVYPSQGNVWRFSRETFKKLLDDNRIWFGEDGDNMPRVKRFLSETNPGIVPISLWSYEDVGHTQSASQELKKLFNDKDYFDYPKPVELIKRCLQIASDKDSIILDFFSGSATTAHAVMQLNAEDNGERKFILVQLPEDCDEKSEAFKDGYKNICEIGKERIRRAGEKLKEEIKNSTKVYGKDKKDIESTAEDVNAIQMVVDILKSDGCDNIENFKSLADKKIPDIGFRVFKLDTSCMKDVYYNPGDLSQDLLAGLEDNIKEDRTPEDLLFQVMLDMGVMLSSEIQALDIHGKKVFDVNEGNLVCCFDKNLTDEVVTEIAKMQPLYAVFRDASMNTDSVAVNFDQIFETYSPTTTRKVL